MSDERPLSDSDRAMLSQRVDQFHTDLANGPVADWDPYLLRLPAHVRRAVLAEMVVVHLTHEWSAGRRPLVEDYLNRFPDLGPADRVPVAVVAEEYRCRLTAGLPKGTDGYRDRFPAVFDALREPLAEVEREAASRASAGSGLPPVPLRGYQKITWLGGGAFADVWLAKNPSGYEKALKVVKEKITRDAAQREKKALEQVKNIQHACLLRTEDYWIENQQLYIVTELAEMTLKDRLEQCVKEEGLPGIPTDELFPYVRDAARGLDYLHANKVTHWDVKPENILLVRGGAAKVADFGLARKQENQITQLSVVMGTMAYMAPEVFGREGGPASDQYSLAVTYAHLRQGFVPVKLLPYPQIMMEHVDGAYEFADLIGPDERAVLRRALSQLPQQRFPTCQEFMAALAPTIGEVYKPPKKPGTGSQPVLPPIPPPPPPRPIPDEHARKTTEVWKEPPLPPPPPPPPPPVIVPPLVVVQPPPPLLPLLVIGGLILVLGGLVAMAFIPSAGCGATADTSPTTGTGPSDDTPPTVSPPSGRPSIGTKPTGPPQVKVAPKPDRDWVAVGTETIETTTGPRPKWIAVTVRGHEVRFRFVPGNGTVPPFYLAEEKIPNRVFFETVPAGADPTAPAVGMTWAEAAAFAKRFPGGRLPTPAEYDHAGGPTLPGGVPWVDQDKPSPSRRGLDTADQNAFGLLDLHGNGAEWTSETLRPAGTDRPLAVTRGRRYTMPKDPPKAAVVMTAFADRGNPHTGFRVALPAPPPDK